MSATGHTRALAKCLDAITQPTPNQAWLASIKFDELKTKWADEDRCIQILEQFWRNRCAAMLGEQ